MFKLLMEKVKLKNINVIYIFSYFNDDRQITYYILSKTAYQCLKNVRPEV